MKTISEIADELGIPRQKVYRYIKKENISSTSNDKSTINHDTSNDKRVMYFDDVAISNIKSYFQAHNPSKEINHDESNDKSTINHDTSKDMLIDVLKTELEFRNKEIENKNKEISTLMNQMENMQILLKQEQNTVKLLEEKHTPFINKIFKNKKNDD
jgi:predicted transcriptional regulator